jgi:hypothetical protein
MNWKRTQYIRTAIWGNFQVSACSDWGDLLSELLKNPDVRLESRVRNPASFQPEVFTHSTAVLGRSHVEWAVSLVTPDINCGLDGCFVAAKVGTRDRGVCVPVDTGHPNKPIIAHRAL